MNRWEKSFGRGLSSSRGWRQDVRWIGSSHGHERRSSPWPIISSKTSSCSAKRRCPPLWKPRSDPSKRVLPKPPKNISTGKRFLGSCQEESVKDTKWRGKSLQRSLTFCNCHCGLDSGDRRTWRPRRTWVSWPATRTYSAPKRLRLAVPRAGLKRVYLNWKRRRWLWRNSNQNWPSWRMTLLKPLKLLKRFVIRSLQLI